LRTLIVYNDSESGSDADDDPDLISEVAVKDEADAVHDALSTSSKCHASVLPLKNLSRDIEKIKALEPELIFNLCEGLNGDSSLEMCVASVWETIGIPYTGNPPLTLGLSRNKVLSKMIFKSAGIPTPDFEVFNYVPDNTCLEFPVIAKPAEEDASLGISVSSISHDISSLKKSVSHIISKYKQPALVEKFIDGREFNLSVLGNNPPKVIGVAEIDFSSLDKKLPRITSYESKWIKDHVMYSKTPSICPANVDEKLKSELESVALKTYRVLGGRDYGRIDIRVDKRDNTPYVLEYNPNPDISPDAGFAKALKAAGISYEEFVFTIAEEAIKRNRK